LRLFVAAFGRQGIPAEHSVAVMLGFVSYLAVLLTDLLDPGGRRGTGLTSVRKLQNDCLYPKYCYRLA